MERHQQNRDAIRNHPLFSTVIFLMACGVGAISIVGCATTAQQGPSVVQRIEGEKPAPPAPTGFLGNYYSLLKPGSAGQLELRYVNPQVDWSQYNKILLSPVTFWGDDSTKLSEAEQNALTTYFYATLKEQLGKKFTLVNDPGPGVIRITVALTDAQAATPVLRTISVVVPQAHALNMLKDLVTGTYAFVGSATAEAKITDSMTGQLLGAFADKRFGTAAVSTAGTWQWQDAKRAMDAWSTQAATRLAGFRAQGNVAAGTPDASIASALASSGEPRVQ